MKRLSKQDIIESAVDKLTSSGAKPTDHISKQAVGQTLEAVLMAIEEALTMGKDVTLTGFGSFKVKSRTARMGRNPQTGEMVQVPAKRVVKFKAGADLESAVATGVL